MHTKKTNSDYFPKLRERAEEELRKHPADLSEIPPGRMLHELLVHRIELEMQNDELRLTQQKLERVLDIAHENYFNLFNNSPVGYITMNEQKLIQDVNITIEKMLGLGRTELLNKPLTSFIVRDDQDLYYLYSKKLLDTRKQQTCELRMTCYNGAELWVQLETGILKDEKTGTNIYCTVISEITSRKQAEEENKKLLAEKEVILKEVHHRIRNNMNTIVDLLALQAARLKEPLSIAALKDAESRVLSMLVLYDKLYSSSNFRDISAEEYLPALIKEIVAIFPNKDLVEIEQHIEDFLIGPETQLPLGIIINEIITNAMKHAFKNMAKGLIRVTASLKGQRMTISIWNNGCIMPEPADMKGSNGFGLHLIALLTKQLNGAFKIERNNGTSFVLEFDV